MLESCHLRGSDTEYGSMAHPPPTQWIVINVCCLNDTWSPAAVYADVRYRLLGGASTRIAERAFTSQPAVHRERQPAETEAARGALTGQLGGSKDSSGSREDELERQDLDALQQQRQQEADGQRPSLKDNLKNVTSAFE